jgi:hypothetical protein
MPSMTVSYDRILNRMHCAELSTTSSVSSGVMAVALFDTPSENDPTMAET